MEQMIALGTKGRGSRWLAKGLCALAVMIWLGGGVGDRVFAADGAYQTVDLAPVFVSASIRTNAVTGAAVLPRGVKEFGGVPFKIDGLLPVTGMEDVRHGELHPTRIADIPVRRRAAQLHLLHGVDGEDKDGVPFATLVLHYANGEERTIRLAHGVQARGWSGKKHPTLESLVGPESRIVLSSSTDDSERGRSGLRLYHSVLRNPLPEQEIVRLEFVSLFSQATPFIAGLTTSSASDVVPATPAASARRVIKKSLEHPDAVYRSEFVVRTMDTSGGQPITNATAALTIHDDEGALYFGEAAADSAGVIRLPFPPQQTVSYSLLVRAPGRIPLLLQGAKSDAGDFAREQEAKLERGVRIGGIVNDPAGRPIAGAEVLIHKVTSNGPREFTRLDYDTARTSADGKWVSESVPAGAGALAFDVSHPEFRAMLFQGGTNDSKAGLVSESDLVAGKAVMVLPAALRVAGTVTGGNGQVIKGVEIQRVDTSRPVPIPCDDSGKFSFAVPQPGEVTLMVQAKGFKPKLLPVSVEPEMKPLDVRLAKTEPFVGRVVDQSQQPIAGARVRVDSWNGTKLLQWQTVTDAKGGVVWDSPPDGNVMFYVSATNFTSTRMSFGNLVEEQRFTLRQVSRAIGRVVDAETRKPIDEFMVTRGHSYNEGEPMRWERYDVTRGRRGEYSMRLLDYGSSSRSQIMVEAPGYMPVVSPFFTKAGVYTNDFALRKARGLSGVVQLADGSPVTNATVALLEPSDDASMEKPGELRRSGSGGDFQRTNPRGQFEFAPKLEPHTIIASHALGFAEVRASNLIASGKIVLQPWGRLTGKVRVGKGSQQGRTVSIQSTEWEYGMDGRTGPPLSLFLKAETDAEGGFTVDRVPPGERKATLQVKVNDRSSGRGTSTTHGVPVVVKPGATTDVQIGGTGRTVVGTMTVVGGDPEDVDWRRDVHTMQMQIPMPITIQGPVITGNMTEAEQQRAYRDYNERQRAFWTTEEGRALRRKQRSYTLMFETNGTFRVDNVEPGNYYIYVSLTNPERSDNYYESIGSMNKNVVIPAPAAGKVEEAFDLGAMPVQIRGVQRTGRRAPPFETKTFDGKALKLEDFKGKFVFVDFWATWAGTRTLDAQMLKSVYDSYAKDDRFVMIGLNFDSEAAIGGKFAKENDFKWTQCYAGQWGQTTIAASYGIQGLPDNVLIDPEGKIAARNLRGSTIRNTIRTKLGAPKTPGAATAP